MLLVCISIPTNQRSNNNTQQEHHLHETAERFVPHTILLDFATSKTALGKARVALGKGETLRANSAIDADGMPTEDPSVMFPSGRHTVRF